MISRKKYSDRHVNTYLVFLFVLAFYSVRGLTNLSMSSIETAKSFAFIENKGQITDQYGHRRDDILFAAETGGIIYYFKKNGISYQVLKRVRSYQRISVPEDFHISHTMGIQDTVSISRIDLQWLQSDENCKIVAEYPLNEYYNYYDELNPEGISSVRGYSGIVYKNLYPGIDLHFYNLNGKLKYDFIISPQIDYRIIKIQVNGAENIAREKNGSVIIGTLNGDIAEEAPLVFQNGLKLDAHWLIINNILSFDIKNWNPALTIIIDPAVTRLWGTFFGSTYVLCSKTDTAGNAYICGWANSVINIATLGAYQTIYGAGNADAFLSKFNQNGVLQWSTYYGGISSEGAYSCAPDPFGNVFIPFINNI